MSDATTPPLKVSRKGVVLIKSFEGFQPRAVRKGDGRWVIGYGHTASAREGSTVSEQDAELLLQYDLLPVVKALNERVSAPLNQHQFDALASFAISVGVARFLSSDVLQRLNEGHAREAADALMGWPEPTPLNAHLRRRAAERALFEADPATPVHLAALLTAPLPPTPIKASVTEPKQTGAPADARAAAVAALLGEAPPAASTPAAGAGDLTGTGPVSGSPFGPTPFAAPPLAAVNLQRYSPYGATIIGPLPGFPTSGQPSPAPGSEGSADNAALANASTPTPPGPAPGVSPFPPTDQPLGLTPATEADFDDIVPPVGEPEQAAEPDAPDGETVQFEEEPTVSVLRHEAEPAAQRRFDWSVTGAFMIMGLTGLAACGGAAAAFRKAMVDESSLNDYVVIGSVLALIGVICVGVSSWNLFVRWGRRN